ncbi:MAG: phosphatase PAP2 family protein [Minisyncoccia bacterium]
MYSFDIIVQNYFASGRTLFLTEFFYLLTILFDLTTPFILIVFLTSLLVYIVRNIKYSLLFLISIIVGGVSIYFLKVIFNVTRPFGGVMEVFGKSFPSGHTTIATIFFVMLMYIFDDYLSTQVGLSGIWRKVFNTFCTLGILLVAFSRVYLGVHWASDVIGGVVLGALVSYICISLFRVTLNRGKNIQ